MPSFAKAQLLKYGWTEGKGLGKNENGIVDPLRPKLKFDNAGIGHDSREYKWWESLYEKASKNVKIELPQDKKEIKLEAREAFEISSRRTNLKKLAKDGKLRYGNFLKTCTLDKGKLVNDDEAVNFQTREDCKVPSIELTDEELFRACGGRTAHKGARHGLKLGGKLARVAQQEAELLGNKIEPEEWTEVKSRGKKSKRKRQRSSEDIVAEEETATDANANSLEALSLVSEATTAKGVEKKSKSSRRKEKRRLQDLSAKLNAFTLIDEKTDKNSRKKRKIESEKTPLVTEPPTPEEPRKIYSQADTANFRISKRMKKAFKTKEKKRLKNITDCLMAVNLSEDSRDSGRGEDLVCNPEVLRKLKKSKKSKKK